MNDNERRSHLKVWVTHLLLDLPYNLHTHLVFRYEWRPDTSAGIFVHCIMLTIVILPCSCKICRLSRFWNLRALYYVDYRQSGIFVHFIMSIVVLESSCTLLCRLSWVWNLRALYFVDYRKLSCSCTLLCRLSWIWHARRTLYYTAATPSQPLRVCC